MNLINTEYSFSYYNNLYSAKEPQGEVDINELIEIVKYGYIKETIENARNEQDKETYKKIKQGQIPCVTLSGIFIERNSKNLMQHSGLIQIDIDDVDNYDELFDKLSKDIYSYVCFKSPGGKGIKVVVKINPDEITHLEQYYALEKYYLDEFKVKIDSACKDVARCLLLSYDPDIYCNPFSEVFTECLMPETIEQKTNSNKGSYLIDVKSQDKHEVINEIISCIEQNKIDLTDTYENWIKIGFGLSSEFGEAGREYYHRISQFHPDYNPTQCDKQFSNLHHRNNGAIGIGSLIFYAKEKGIDFKLASTKENNKPSKPTGKSHFEILKQKSQTYTFNNVELVMYESLRQLRLRLSMDDRVKPYMIFGNSTLNEIVQHKPTTKQQLLGINGIGQKRADWFGQEILDIIKQEK